MRNRTSLNGIGTGLRLAGMACVGALLAGTLGGCSTFSPLNYNYNYSRRLWENDLFRGNEEYRKHNYKKAQEIFQSAASVAEHFGPLNHRLAISLCYVANCLRHQDKNADAAAILERARKIWSGLLKAGNGGLSERSVEEELADTLTDLASIYLVMGKTDEAGECCAQAIDLYKSPWETEKNKLVGQHFAKALFISGYIKQKGGDVERALESFTHALQVNAAANGTGKSTEALLQSYRQAVNSVRQPMQENGSLERNIGKIDSAGAELHAYSTLDRTAHWRQLLNDAKEATDRGNDPEAERLYRLALKAVDGPGTNQIRLAESLHPMANLFARTENYAQAEHYYRRLIQVLESSLGARDPYLFDPLRSLGHIYQVQNKLTDAQKNYERAIAICEQAKDSRDTAATAECLRDLGHVYQAQNKLTDAQKHYERAIAIWERANDSRDTAAATECLKDAAVVYDKLQQRPKAIAVLLKALKLNEGVYGKESLQLIWFLHYLADLYRDQKMYAQEEEYLTRLVALTEKNSAVDPNDAITYGLHRCASLQAQCKTIEAAHSVEHVLASCRLHHLLESPPKLSSLNFEQLYPALANMASLFKNEHRYPEAEEYYKKLIVLKGKAPANSTFNFTPFIEDYAKMLKQSGRETEARELMAKAGTVRRQPK